MVITTVKQIRFKKRPVVNTEFFTLALAPSYCQRARYLNVFPYRKRSRLEKAMLIFGCDVIYLANLMNATLPMLMANRDWKTKWFPEVWRTALATVGLSQTDFIKLEEFKDVTNSEMFQIFGTLYDSRIYNLIKKGYYK